MAERWKWRMRPAAALPLDSSSAPFEGAACRLKTGLKLHSQPATRFSEDSMHRLSSAAAAAALVFGVSCNAQAAPDWNQVAQALGKTGTEMPGGVYRVGLPRSDLHVQLGGI